MKIRKREPIIISKPVDLPYQSDDQTLCYDSIVKHFHNGFTRGQVDIVAPNHPLNGVAGHDPKNKITHRVRVFKHELYETGDVVLWMDGKVPRTLRVQQIMQDKISRRHVNLYCVEKQIGENVNKIEVRSTFGSEISSTPLTY